jgi:condensin complex subunit 2
VFSRTAKRVDVQKLKENLWSKLVPENYDLSLHESIQEDGSILHEDMGCEKNFMEVCKELDTLYEEKPRKDISVAFCFICVLHLANENNLAIIGSDSLRELTIKG